jgi:hypothetical protein
VFLYGKAILERWAEKGISFLDDLKKFSENKPSSSARVNATIKITAMTTHKHNNASPTTLRFPASSQHGVSSQTDDLLRPTVSGVKMLKYQPPKLYTQSSRSHKPTIKIHAGPSIVQEGEGI